MLTLDAIRKFSFSTLISSGVEMLCIEMDNHFGVFIPGNRVSGVVRLTLSNAIKANKLRLSIYGIAKTSWIVTQNSLTHYMSDQRPRCDAIPYEAEELYLRGETALWTVEDTSSGLPSGTHTFPFSFDLPVHCPPSFEGTVGYVRYYCKALLDRPWKLDQTTKRVFTVIPMVDLNQLPTASLPVEVQQSEQVGLLCLKQGVVDVQMSISKSGHVPGESIAVSLRIFNGSSRTIRRIDLRLVENASYTACAKGPYLHPASAPVRSTIERRRHTRTMCQLTEELAIKPGSLSVYKKFIRIPPTAPTFNNCPIIQVEYFLQAQITAKGFLQSTILTQVPILIGTVPIKSLPMLDAQSDQNDVTCGHSSGTGDEPPTYEDCVFGKGTIQDEEDSDGFAPKYMFYNNMQLPLT